MCVGTRGTPWALSGPGAGRAEYGGTSACRMRFVIPTGAKRNGEPVLSEVEWKSGTAKAMPVFRRAFRDAATGQPFQGPDVGQETDFFAARPFDFTSFRSG